MFSIGTLSQTLTLCAAFASSTYLLSQIPGPGRSSDDDLLNPPPSPLFKGRSGPTGFPSPRCLPCPPAPARHLRMPCYTFGHASSFCHVPTNDAPRGLCVLHVFALANTRTRLSQSPYPPFQGGTSGLRAHQSAWPPLRCSSAGI